MRPGLHCRQNRKRMSDGSLFLSEIRCVRRTALPATKQPISYTERKIWFILTIYDARYTQFTKINNAEAISHLIKSERR